MIHCPINSQINVYALGVICANIISMSLNVISPFVTQIKFLCWIAGHFNHFEMANQFKFSHFKLVKMTKKNLLFGCI